MRLMDILSPLWETMKGILPLTAILSVVQVVILRKPMENVRDFIIGVILATIGLHLFLKGTNMSLIPLGDSVGRNLYVLNRKWVIILLGFIIGYFGTLVEPALKTLALEVEELSAGAIPHKVLIHGVAAGFGLGMGIGLLKIIANIPYIKIIVPLLLLVIVLAFFAPEPFGSIAMDSASATTGPVNIPLNMALAIGLASIIEGVDPLLSGFGIIGLTSIGAMVSVLVLGILTKF
ncbi:DUF1538 domain-containing protein [Lachnospiraceae bacterium NSJ-29]|uniref:DUF1538 domain-containing protein n=2 Tax=Wansuia hejianensis TaxID=2763667 RepID=A0A926INU4_9FIRM|nr:DUF1538 domain-containing protein [Wansuia hejianensis]